MTISREPSGDGSGSYSSPGVLIAGPRFSTIHSPVRFDGPPDVVAAEASGPVRAEVEPTRPAPGAETIRRPSS